MSKPDAGNYYIINQATFSTAPLALYYNSTNPDVTVKSWISGSSRQAWTISDYSDGVTQTVSPLNAANLQIGMGNGILQTLPAGNFVWYIRGDDVDGYTVQDGDQTVFWDLAEPVASGETVSFGPGTGSTTQQWQLIAATDVLL